MYNVKYNIKFPLANNHRYVVNIVNSVANHGEECDFFLITNYNNIIL